MNQGKSWEFINDRTKDSGPGHIEQFETELQQARQTTEFWKAEHLSGNKLIDELRAKVAELESRLSTMTQAVGLATTLKPDMEIDVENPVGMIQEVVEAVNAEKQRLLTVVKQARLVLKHGKGKADSLSIVVVGLCDKELRRQATDLHEGEHKVSDFNDPVTEAEWWARGRIEQLEAELETERMRLVACGVVAMANTPESAAKAIDMLPKYDREAYENWFRAKYGCEPMPRTYKEK